MEALPALSAPSTRLVARSCPEDQIPIGGNKLGGCPDLANGETWPEQDEVPLAFLARVAYESGWLSFFYNPEEQPWCTPVAQDHGRVVYVTEAAQRRTALAKAATFPACALDSFAELALRLARNWGAASVRRNTTTWS
jgi:uncharacterized protein YwqG